MTVLEELRALLEENSSICPACKKKFQQNLLKDKECCSEECQRVKYLVDAIDRLSSVPK